MAAAAAAACAAAPGTTVVPTPLFYVGVAYIALTAVIGVVVGMFVSPMLILTRRKSQYFHDYNKNAIAAPWLFWHIGGLLYRISERLGNHVLPAPQRVVDLVGNYMRSAAVLTINELEIPELLKDGPKTGEELAAAAGCHLEYLERVLRLCDRLALVRIERQPAAPKACRPARTLYHITQLSSVLCEEHPNSVKHMVGLFADHYEVFAKLTEGVKKGETPFLLHSGGVGHWDHMRAEPRLYDRFNKAMANFNNLCPIEAVFREVDFSRYDRLVDVGGGLGQFVAAAMRRAPGLRGHLFDLPGVIKQAREVWAADAERAAMLPRMSFTAGSFFDEGAVPRALGAGREVFVMRQILHDWPDAECVSILKRVRAAIGDAHGPDTPPAGRCSGGGGGAAADGAKNHGRPRLLIVESCIASDKMINTHTARITGDVHMLTMYGGAKERTEAQFAALLHEAGFRLDSYTPTKSLFFVLTCSLLP